MLCVRGFDMGIRIHRVTIERLKRIQELLPGTFACMDIKADGKQKLLNVMSKAKTIGYKRMPELNIPITNKYKVFTYNDNLYVARIK